MKSSLLLSIGFLALLALAVTLKVSSKRATEAVSVDFGGETARVLTEHGFWVVGSRDGMLPTIEARTATCGVAVASLSPLGFSWDVFRRSASPGTNVFVTYDGRRYEEQPRWLTTFGFYWTRLNRVVGRLIAQPPVLGVAAGRSCQPDEVRWLDHLQLARGGA